tara:strand:- start:67 stop:207 length:141 start_codon:yes stop_codon:yes gene_type:complete
MFLLNGVKKEIPPPPGDKAKHFCGPVNAVPIYLTIVALFIYSLMEM